MTMFTIGSGALFVILSILLYWCTGFTEMMRKKLREGGAFGGDVRADAVQMVTHPTIQRMGQPIGAATIGSVRAATSMGSGISGGISGQAMGNPGQAW